MNLSFSFLRTVTSVVIVLLTLTGLSETNHVTNSDSEPGNPNLMLLDCQKYIIDLEIIYGMH